MLEVKAPQSRQGFNKSAIPQFDPQGHFLSSGHRNALPRKMAYKNQGVRFLDVRGCRHVVSKLDHPAILGKCGSDAVRPVVGIPVGTLRIRSAAFPVFPRLIVPLHEF